jgi:hypothetical protein
LFEVAGVGRYRLLGDTKDDAAGEAFDKTAKLLGLDYPGGPALARLAEAGRDGAVSLPRPMLASGDLDMSFSGLKTAALLLVRREAARGTLDDARRADIAREFQHAVVDVLVAKAVAALDATGAQRLVVAGGVGANRELRARLAVALGKRGGQAFFPDFEFCTDNGAMIALAGALRLSSAAATDLAFRSSRAGTWRRYRRFELSASVLRSRPIVRSLPSSNCRMFDRCRQKSSSEIGTIAHAVGALPKTTNALIGSAAVASANERADLEAQRHDEPYEASAGPSGQLSAKTMPAAVRPLPPAKPWNTGNR